MFQMLSPFLVALPKRPYPISLPMLTNPPTPPTLAVLLFPYTGALSLLRAKGLSSLWCPIMASSTTYAAGAMCHFICNLLLAVYNIWVEEYGLFHIVFPPMVLQAPSATFVLSIAAPLGTVQWLAEITHLCICQELAEPMRRLLDQPPASKCLLSSILDSGLGDNIWRGSTGAVISGWPFFHSLLQILSQYLFPWVFCSLF